MLVNGKGNKYQSLELSEQKDSIANTGSKNTPIYSSTVHSGVWNTL
jgi:hypothetical protein